MFFQNVSVYRVSHARYTMNVIERVTYTVYECCVLRCVNSATLMCVCVHMSSAPATVFRFDDEIRSLMMKFVLF